MKNLLSMLAVSTLVGTSASNLKPVFTSNVVNHGFKSNQLNNKDISIQNENDNFANKVISNGLIKKIVITDDDVMWVATDKGLYKSTDGTIFNNVFNQNITALININNTIYVGTNGASLYKSTDGINFQQVNGVPNDLYINDIAIAFDKSIYVGTEKGLWKSTDGIKFEQIQTTGISKNSSIESLSIISNQVIYIGLNGKGLWKSTDGINFQQVNGITNTFSITSISIAANGTIYIIVIDGINHNLYKSIDGFDFNKIIDIPDGLNHQVININIDLKNTIYVGTNGTELYKSINGKKFNKIELDKEIHDEIISNFLIDKVKNIYIGTDKGLFKINNLIKINKPNYLGNLYNGIVYNSAQKIDIKENLVASATLDGKSISIPTTNLDIPVGEHTLILILKDQYKQYIDLFDGDVTTGKVIYKLWVKTAIDKNKIDYQTKIDDTELFTGLVSNAGNTNMKDIIQTKIKNGIKELWTRN